MAGSHAGADQESKPRPDPDKVQHQKKLANPDTTPATTTTQPKSNPEIPTKRQSKSVTWGEVRMIFRNPYTSSRNLHSRAAVLGVRTKGAPPVNREHAYRERSMGTKFSLSKGKDLIKPDTVYYGNEVSMGTKKTNCPPNRYSSLTPEEEGSETKEHEEEVGTPKTALLAVTTVTDDEPLQMTTLLQEEVSSRKRRRMEVTEDKTAQKFEKCDDIDRRPSQERRDTVGEPRSAGLTDKGEVETGSVIAPESTSDAETDLGSVTVPESASGKTKMGMGTPFGTGYPGITTDCETGPDSLAIVSDERRAETDLGSVTVPKSAKMGMSIPFGTVNPGITTDCETRPDSPALVSDEGHAETDLGSVTAPKSTKMGTSIPFGTVNPGITTDCETGPDPLATVGDGKRAETDWGPVTAPKSTTMVMSIPSGTINPGITTDCETGPDSLTTISDETRAENRSLSVMKEAPMNSQPAKMRVESDCPKQPEY